MQLISERIISEIIKLTNERDLNQNDLAELLECTPAYISQLIKGKKKPSLSFLDKVEKKMKIQFSMHIIVPYGAN